MKTGKLLVLFLTHLTVDFYAGLTLPLPEPTLVDHYGASLVRVMLLVATSAIVCNAIQPIAGFLLPRRPLPILLWVCPLLSATVCLIGLSSHYGSGWLFLLVSAVGIGLVHPEAVLAAQTLSGRRLGMVTSIFMSIGFFGFSLGSLAGGWWGYRLGLDYFWILAAPALLTAVLVWTSGLYSVRVPTSSVKDDDTRGPIPFVWVFLLSALMAINLTVLYRLLPIYMVRRFGAEAQAEAGTLLFLIGLVGAFGAFVWGALSDRIGAGRTLIVVYLAGLPAVVLLLRMSAPSGGYGWALLAGLTVGGSFPLAVVLARQAKSVPLRLRLGLCIGGAWGLGELSVIGASAYIDASPPGDGAPVLTLLRAAPLLMLLVVLLGFRMVGYEKT